MRMVIFAAFFTLGVWLLQQQSALPDFAWAWPLLGIPLLLIARPRWGRLPARSVRVALIAAFACGLGFYHAAWLAEQRQSISLADEWQGRDIEVAGVVAELPRNHEHGQRFRFEVEQTLTPHAFVPHRIYLSTYLPETSHWNVGRASARHVGLALHSHSTKPQAASRWLKPDLQQDKDAEPLVLKAGERWQLTLRLKQPHGSSNPHGFEFEMWALENNIRAVGYVHNKGNNIRLDQQADGFGYRIESWREIVRDKFSATLGDAPYAGVLSALAIGDQGSISASQWQVFTRTGVNHLMSISGLHITMLASLGFAITYWLWRRSTYLTLRLPARKAAALAALLVALGYALLSGFAVPAQRTVYMVAAVAAALWLNRNFSLAQILCIALLWVMIPDPWAVISPGFWLSFGAVALIMYVSAYRIDIGHRSTESATAPGYAPSGRVHWLGEYASVQWAMTIGLIPMLLGLFQQVSLVSPIANALAIPLISLIVVPLTLLGAVLPPYFSDWNAPLWLAHYVMSWVMALLEWLSDLPQAVWTQHAPPAWSVVAGMLGVMLILLPRGFPARWLGLLLLLPMFLNTPEPPAPGTLRLIIFDVGQGLAVAAQTRHHTLLYDAGPDFSDDADSGNRILIPALRALGINRLDGLMLTHDDSDHTGGAASVMQDMPIGWLSSSLPDGHALLQPVADIRRCSDGQSWQWDGISFEILHPDAASYAAANIRDNNRGCVLRISAGDQHILLTADIEKESEQQLLKEHADELPAALLVVPHHGSKSSSTDGFVSAVSPDHAVFTVGYRNSFGHPKREIVQRYADNGAQLLRSDEDGAILVEMDAQGLQVERYRKSHRRYWTHSPQH